MDSALSILGLTYDTLTAENLKRAFKRAAVSAHPDKGGDEFTFDRMVEAYVFLTTHLRRDTGGRDGLSILDPRDVEQSRKEQFERELNNMVFDLFNGSDQPQMNQEFHDAFERLHVSEQQGGYGQWLKDQMETETDTKIDAVDSPCLDPAERFNKYMNDPYAAHWWKGEEVPIEAATTTPFDHRAFETIHPSAPVTTLCLLEMATYSRPTGTLILSSENGFHDVKNGTDLLSAYDTNAMMWDKVPALHGALQGLPTMEEIIAKRAAAEAAPQTDVEMEERAAYDHMRQEKEREHQRKITEYYAAAPSSQWALPAAASTAAVSFIKTL